MQYLLSQLNRMHARRQQGPPQNQPIPRSGQVSNSAAGYVWTVDDWTRLQRFIVLGGEGGSYYASEEKLSIENAKVVLRCIEADGPRAVETIAVVSEAGRAPKNDPALFALALCTARGDEETRQAAMQALPRVARIGTHLFHFVAFVDALRGWGRGLRQAVGNWYNARPARDLAYQALKYQQRDGWSHRDVLRLAHPKAPDEQHQTIYHWMTQGWAGPVPLSPRQRLDDVMKQVAKMPMGGTDCALPMVWAMEQGVAADVFVVYTDSETWYGQIDPAVALQQYRAKTGIAAKLVVVGMLANSFSIADPNDAGMLDCVGFDTATPPPH